MANQQARHLRRTMTPQEAKLWLQLRALRAEGYHFRRQVPIGTFIADFACLKHNLVVEVDDSGHARHARCRAGRSSADDRVPGAAIPEQRDRSKPF